jgi:hypothetical protein
MVGQFGRLFLAGGVLINAILADGSLIFWTGGISTGVCGVIKISS